MEEEEEEEDHLGIIKYCNTYIIPLPDTFRANLESYYTHLNKCHEYMNRYASNDIDTINYHDGVGDIVLDSGGVYNTLSIPWKMTYQLEDNTEDAVIQEFQLYLINPVKIAFDNKFAAHAYLESKYEGHKKLTEHIEFLSKFMYRNSIKLISRYILSTRYIEHVEEGDESMFSAHIQMTESKKQIGQLSRTKDPENW